MSFQKVRKVASIQAQPGIELDMSLREQKKQETRAAILRAAHQHFRKKGYDETTIDEICATVEISKRTFFRYFPDKETLVFPNRDERLIAFTAFLEEYKTSENPFDTLRIATDLFGTAHLEKKERLLSRYDLILSSSSLRGREREIDQDWEDAIASAFATRTAPGAENALWARVRAGAVMGVVRATVTHWFETGCEEDLSALGHAAIDRLEAGFGIDSLEH